MQPMNGQQLSGDQQTEQWRQFHAQHLERQTRAIEQTRTIVAIWFWLTIIGAVLIVALALSENA